MMAEAALKEDSHLLDLHCRRVTLPDLQDLAPFLLARLRPKYPHLQDRQIHGWLTNLCMAPTNDFLFLRTTHSCGLAQVVHDKLSPTPKVEEIFVVAKNRDYIREAAEFYAKLLDWSRNIGATEILVENGLTDVPRELIHERAQKTFGREVRYMKLFK